MLLILVYCLKYLFELYTLSLQQFRNINYLNKIPHLIVFWADIIYIIVIQVQDLTEKNSLYKNGRKPVSDRVGRHREYIMNQIKLDKKIFEICDLKDKKSDLNYWLSRTPEERIAAIELMREINYGYNPATDRLQRFFEITELSSG